jgi:hypothetical protein
LEERLARASRWGARLSASEERLFISLKELVCLYGREERLVHIVGFIVMKELILTDPKLETSGL